MQTIIPNTTRVQAERTGDGLRLKIPAKRNYFLIFFLLAWLGGWTIGGLGAGSALLFESQPYSAKAFMAFWLCAWALGEAFAIAAVAWSLVGIEVIQLETNRLTVGWRIGSLKRERAFDILQVKDLRLMPSPSMMNPSDAFAFWGLSGGTIGFDYGAKTYRFGRGMDEAEAKMLLKQVKETNPKLLGDKAA